MTYVHPTSVIYPGVEIFENVYIGPHCIIGAPPEIRGFSGHSQGVYIMPGARLEKAVIVDAGSEETTVIGSKCMLMSGVHVGHDVYLSNNVTISPNASIGGHVAIYEGAYIGMGATIHQKQKIGAFSIIGMNAVITKSAVVLPCSKWVGSPARNIGLNTVGMERNNITKEKMNELIEDFKKYLL